MQLARFLRVPNHFHWGILGLATALVATPVAAGPTLLYEARSGEVLYEEDAGQLWYPASLVKMMTAYMTFEAVREGRLAWNGTLELSEYARSQPATRMGLRQGLSVTIEETVKALIMRSANDFAVALAENIAGSEADFVIEMNATARRLGMLNTRFTNPHGLPDPEQVTTAYDLALLTSAILRDFPERAEIFSTAHAPIAKGAIHSSNDLLRTVAGADGMKTGFTCGSGYNIVASASREGRQIIAVVLGEFTRQARSLRAAALLEYGFKVAGWKHLIGAPKLGERHAAAAETVPLLDMTKLTRTRKCGNSSRDPFAEASLPKRKK